MALLAYTFRERREECPPVRSDISYRGVRQRHRSRSVLGTYYASKAFVQFFSITGNGAEGHRVTVTSLCPFHESQFPRAGLKRRRIFLMEATWWQGLATARCMKGKPVSSLLDEQVAIGLTRVIPRAGGLELGSGTLRRLPGARKPPSRMQRHAPCTNSSHESMVTGGAASLVRIWRSAWPPWRAVVCSMIFRWAQGQTSAENAKALAQFVEGDVADEKLWRRLVSGWIGFFMRRPSLVADQWPTLRSKHANLTQTAC